MNGLEQLETTLEKGVYPVPTNEAKLVPESVNGKTTLTLNISILAMVDTADFTDLTDILIE